MYVHTFSVGLGDGLVYKAKYEKSNEITVTSLVSEKSVQFKSHGLILSWYVYTIYRCQDQLLDKTML